MSILNAWLMLYLYLAQFGCNKNRFIQLLTVCTCIVDTYDYAQIELVLPKLIVCNVTVCQVCFTCPLSSLFLSLSPG